MKKKVVYVGLTMCVVGATVWWWNASWAFSSEASIGQASVENDQASIAAHKENQNGAGRLQSDPSVSGLGYEEVQDTSEPEVDFTHGATGNAQDDNPYAEEALKAQFMQIADEYEAAIQYPVTSQPILNQDDLQRYLPPDTADTELPFPLPDYDKPVRLRLQLERYQYYQGESIPVGLVVEGARPSAQVNTVVQLKSLDGSVIQQQTLVQDDNSGLLFTVLSPNADLSWPAEMQVLALVELDDQLLSISAPLKYQSPSATLTSVGYSQVNGEWLDIPVVLNVHQSGYYFISANLYSASTEAPLVHLESEGALSGNPAVLNLNVHYSALKAKGDEGDYLLKDIRIIRAAGDNETADVAGFSPKSAYPVVGYSFSSYIKKDYVDPDAEERLAFLRRLGSIGAQ